MSAYYSYLERQNRLSRNQLKLKQKWDISNNLFVGYNEKYRNEQDVDNFIDFYKPIILKEIKYLYGDESLRLKTEVKTAWVFHAYLFTTFRYKLFTNDFVYKSCIHFLYKKIIPSEQSGGILGGALL